MGGYAWRVIVPTEQGFRIVRAAEADPGAEGVARAVCAPGWWSDGEVLKSNDRTTVAAGEVDGRAVVVKVVAADAGKGRVARVFGRTRGMRQWRGAERVERAGLRVAAPIVLVEARSADGRAVEVLVMERARGPTLLEVIASGAQGGLGVRAEHALAREVGRVTASLTGAGIFNRDHKPSNFIVTGTAEAPELVFIDTVGIGRRSSFRRVARMLANLRHECAGTRCLPRRAVQMRVVRTLVDAFPPPPEQHSERIFEWVTEVDRLVRVHGDPTPKDDPLARSAEAAR